MQGVPHMRLPSIPLASIPMMHAILRFLVQFFKYIAHAPSLCKFYGRISL